MPSCIGAKRCTLWNMGRWWKKEAGAVYHVKVWRQKRQRWALLCEQITQSAVDSRPLYQTHKALPPGGKLWLPSAPIIAPDCLLFGQIMGLPISTMLFRLPFPHWSSHLEMNSELFFIQIHIATAKLCQLFWKSGGKTLCIWSTLWWIGHKLLFCFSYASSSNL